MRCGKENPLFGKFDKAENEGVFLTNEVILAYLESAEHVKLQSPNFEVQLKVRENVNYYEPCSTIAMAVEAEIPAIIGETMLAQNLIDRFKNYIVRPDELEEMMGIACNSCFVREYQNNKG